MEIADDRKVDLVIALLIQLADHPAEGIALLAAAYIKLCADFRLDNPSRERIADDFASMVKSAEKAGLQ